MISETELPQPLKEILWLLTQYGRATGDKKDKIKQKISNWKKAYPEYNDIVIELLESQKTVANKN